MEMNAKANYDTWMRKKILKIGGFILLTLLLLGILILVLRQFGYGNEHKDEENIHLSEEDRHLDIEITTPLYDNQVGLEKQIDLEAQIHELINQTAGIIGLSYYCLTTSRHITINADQTFFSASTIKLPTHMMIAELVEVGILSWEQMLTVKESDWLGGSGILQYGVNIGYELTLYEVMRHSIIYSDNLAHRMLTRTLIPGFQHGYFGLDNSHWHLTAEIFNRYLSGESPTGRMELSPNHLTEIFRILYHDHQQISGYEIILEYMMNTAWTDGFASSITNEVVAHIPGWRDPEHHDSGIFFIEEPYILIVMTSGVFDAATFISRISDLVLEYHALK